MKELILLGGPMGVGKTTAGRLLRDKLAPAFFLDGDWCWDMSPFDPCEENRRMVLDNIAHLLAAFLDNPGCGAVVFCWVMDRPEIIRDVLAPPGGEGIPAPLFFADGIAGGAGPAGGRGCSPRAAGPRGGGGKPCPAAPVRGSEYRKD